MNKNKTYIKYNHHMTQLSCPKRLINHIYTNYLYLNYAINTILFILIHFNKIIFTLI